MNKQLKFFFTFFVAALCLGFTACSDDDDDDYAKDIAGTYKGAMTVMEQQVPDVEIELKRKALNKITLEVNVGAFLQVDQNISVDANVIYSNNQYAFSATTLYDYVISPELTIPLPIGVTGTVDKKGNMVLSISVGQGVEYPPFPILVAFEGKKK